LIQHKTLHSESNVHSNSVTRNSSRPAIFVHYNRVNLCCNMTNLPLYYVRFNRVFVNNRVCYNRVSLYKEKYVAEMTPSYRIYLRISQEILDKIWHIFLQFNLFAGRKFDPLKHNTFPYLCVLGTSKPFNRKIKKIEFWSFFSTYFQLITRVDLYASIYGTSFFTPTFAKISWWNWCLPTLFRHIQFQVSSVAKIKRKKLLWSIKILMKLLL
jgi:hypothetical protein